MPADYSLGVALTQRMPARLRAAMPDLVVVIAMWLLLLWGVGAQWWTGLNAPDSQFSASLVIFGDRVNERAIDPSYYWTRLGYLGPVRALTEVFGIWAGFAIWRALLLLIVLTAVYWVARQLSARPLAAALALFVGLNTMVLGYLGNPYATGTAMAASLALLAIAVAQLRRSPGRRMGLVLGAGAGGLLAWLVMLNPYNALLAGCTWLGIRLVGILASRTRVRGLLEELAAIAAGFAVVFLGFIAWGMLLFPGRNWIETYRSWNARLDYASFISDTTIWTRDSAALVVLLGLLVSLVAIVFVRNRWSAAAVVCSAVTIGFTLLYMQLIPGPWIEAPHYAAMCWPGALLSIVLALGALVGQRPPHLLAWVALPFLVIAMVWAGHSAALLSMRQGLLLVLACLVLVVALALVRSLSRSALVWLLAMLVIAMLGVSAQWLQNGRGNLGIYSQYPMNAAFVDYQAEQLMRSNVAAEEFVLAHTTDEDRIATWTDPSRLTATVAAMQLWGIYNNAPGEGALTLADQKALRELNPTVLALYAPDREQIDAYFRSIPAWYAPTPLECTAVPYLGIGSPDAHVCLTRVTVQ